jgi:hypothetical protein
MTRSWASKRLERLERRVIMEGRVFYIAAPQGMETADALANLGISVGQHDRVSRSTAPSAAPELIATVPAYLPPGGLADVLESIAGEPRLGGP